MDNKQENRYEFFMFQGKCYGKGTIVKFKEPHFSLKETYNYGKFFNGSYLNGYGCFYLCNNDASKFGNCHTSFYNSNPEQLIEEIVVPVEVPYVDPKDKKYAYNDIQAGTFEGWIIYLFVMFISVIFKTPLRLFIWAVASFYFFGWRHEVLKGFGYK